MPREKLPLNTSLETWPQGLTRHGLKVQARAGPRQPRPLSFTRNCFRKTAL